MQKSNDRQSPQKLERALVKEDSYSLSPMQQGMVFHNLFQEQYGTYIEQLVGSFRENLNVEAFKESWQQVLERHSILRTSFDWDDSNRLVQSVYDRVKLPLKQEDWRKLSLQEREQRLNNYLQNDRQRGFDFKEVPLIRLALFRLAEEEYKLIWTFHHAILDGRSYFMILKEVFTIYEAICKNREIELEKPRPYRDYIDWLQQQTISQSEEEFWRDLLKDFTAPNQLPAIGKPVQNSYGTEKINLSVANTSALQALTKDHQLTLNTLIQGAWAILLSRYTDSSNVVFGALRACRYSALENMELMVGLFINTLPVRVNVEPDRELLPWLSELRSQWIELRKYEQTSLLKIQEWSEIPRGTPLFESTVVFEKYQIRDALQSLEGNWENREFELLEKTSYPISLNVYEEEKLILKINYDGERFDRSQIERMLGHLTTLLTSMAANPHQKLSELPLLTEAERYQILVKWNDTKADYNYDSCIHQLFEEQVQKTPNATAVVFEDQKLTYRELNHRANQLAHYLQKLGVKPDVIVGICMERSPLIIVAILGILKAGGAYVPIDPKYPNERLNYILEDAKASLLLTRKQLLDWQSQRTKFDRTQKRLHDLAATR